MANSLKTKKTVAKSTTVTSIKEVDKTINEILKLADTLANKDKIKLLKKLGVGGINGEYYTCNRCGEVKNKKDFYSSTEPGNKTGITSIDKKCASEIACPIVDGVQTMPDKQSVDNALYALNKPFLDSLWESSMLEAANAATGKTKNNVWTSYIKNVSMVNYVNLTYRESDNYTGGIYSISDLDDDALPKDQEILEQFKKNKDDTLRLIGYLPFEKEKLSDQPFLYAQLIGFLDSSPEGNDDMMRTSSIINIVRDFLQLNQIDDMIADLVKDTKNVEKNIATIKSLQNMKSYITTTITKLAEKSCISLKDSKNAKKGENTWTGKIKKIKELNLFDGGVNGFDLATCRGMQQVQEISDASIFKQLALDDSDWSDMVAQMRKDNTDLRRERDAYKELNRIILRENLDLKDTLTDNGLLDSENIVDLKDLYSIFSSTDDEDVENNNENIEMDGDLNEEKSADISI